MKNKMVFRIAFISLIIFIIVATYFWFLFFREYEGKTTVEKVRFELINNGGINYINAVVNDLEENIPVYYFRVKNNINENINYEIYLEDVNPSIVKDGCSENMLFTRDQLNYELKLENRVIKSGVLASLNKNVLDVNVIPGNSINDYSLRIWLNDHAEEDIQKHYHYIVNIREIG